jgi:hypothetical protein
MGLKEKIMGTFMAVWLILIPVLCVVLAFVSGLTDIDYADLLPWTTMWPIFILMTIPVLFIYLGKCVRRAFSK